MKITKRWTEKKVIEKVSKYQKWAEERKKKTKANREFRWSSPPFRFTDANMYLHLFADVIRSKKGLLMKKVFLGLSGRDKTGKFISCGFVEEPKRLCEEILFSYALLKESKEGLKNDANTASNSADTKSKSSD